MAAKPWVVDGVAVWPPSMKEFRYIVKLLTESLKSTDLDRKAEITAELKQLADNRRARNASFNRSKVSTGIHVCGQPSIEESDIPF